MRPSPLRPWLLPLSLLLLLPLLLLSGCGERDAERDATRPAPTERPAATVPGAGVRLSAPETVTIRADAAENAEEVSGQEVSRREIDVEVVNEGPTPYVFYPVDGDNCLHVEDAGGQRQLLTYPETCDVLMEVSVRPGERAPVGSWDLHACATEDCRRREPVAPGRYTIATTVYPYADGRSVEPGTGIELTADVRVEAAGRE